MLRLEHVDAFYDQSQALRGVNIEVREGEFVTILGDNGAGKTTIMRCVMGLMTPRSGHIHFEGTDLTTEPAWIRSELGIGYVPEGRRVFPELTVEENLRMGGYALTRREALTRNLERAYDLFPRLKERRGQVARTLSGGEQQMLAIARALMIDPRLLLIDEISTGLMPILVNHSFNIIKELHSRGITVLLVEQNANKALQVADRGYVLETGHITMAGSASELREDENVRKAYLGSTA